MAHDDFWWCADETGELHTLTTSELTECLGEGTVPPYALVWQSGWATWTPAARVPELRIALSPDDFEEGPLPSRGGGSMPPAPNLGWYAERRARVRKMPKLDLDFGSLSALAPPRVPAGMGPLDSPARIDEPPSTQPVAFDRPTTRAPEITLPEEAFPERESFVAHVRARQAKKKRPGPPPVPKRRSR